jgi:ribosomal protein L11 methyltransferase
MTVESQTSGFNFMSIQAASPMLWIYELKGETHPRDLPKDELDGVWPEAPYYYLFYRRDAHDSILEWLKSNPRWQLTSQYRLPYSKWQDISVARMRVGPFVIHAAPGLGTISAARDEIPIRIDPGVVFGSGLHPTTRGCLLAISEFFLRDEIQTAVDFGTGTGILAIACALLGARRTWAVDCIPLALGVAVKNASANNVADRIGFLAADRLGVINARSDLLIMNLEWPILEAILKAEDWKNYERVVLSGFLEGRLAALKDMIRPCFQVAETNVIDGWPVVSLISFDRLLH